jgi:hypothetical protein
MTLANDDLQKIDSRLEIRLEQQKNEILEEMAENFATKKDSNDLSIKLDKILKEILASREEETILSYRVSNHDDRITALESTHS